MAIRGRNYAGWLGRGIGADATKRLQRAPAIYFRALGAMATSFGALIAFWGVVFTSVPDHPPAAYVGIAAGLFALFFAATTGSVIWLAVLASRYKLRRWDKP